MHQGIQALGHRNEPSGMSSGQSAAWSTEHYTYESACGTASLWDQAELRPAILYSGDVCPARSSDSLKKDNQELTMEKHTP